MCNISKAIRPIITPKYAPPSDIQVLVVFWAGRRHALSKPDFASFVFEVLRDNVGTPFSIVIGFYFLSQVVSRVGKG